MIQEEPKDKELRCCIEVFDNSGSLVERSYGKSLIELKEDHDKGVCDMWCDFCYSEAMKSIGL